YDSFSGTSMASPHVAGTAALIIADGTTGNTTVRGKLRDMAKDIGSTGKDNHYGYGLVNAAIVSGSTSPTTGSISGTVTDSSTAAAISGASVSTDTGQSTTTAADGTYTLTGVPTGSRTVMASASGYESQSKPAEVTDGGAAVVDFALTEATTSATVTVKSIDYVTYGGRLNDRHLDVTVSVVDGSGTAVSGASVSMRLDNTTTGQSWNATGTTDSDGRVTFSLKSAPDGCYTTTVTALSASGLTWDGTTPPNELCKPA
ncbi:MAG: carboxypeptidase regulatory-like domain-containing protein, partial [Candidatus Limnocylindria bacterium]